ncbi:hypothetical protein Fmac_008765 [Flemingia macrophylla]|uniref:Glycine-rich protein n=1 Tax=Flemingia macrophylla TaxID=520843 RepID=A0ABD1MYC4_9FABA
MLVSTVDLFLGSLVVFSEVAEMETVNGWFRCSPFRIEMVEEKDAVRVGVTFGGGGAATLAKRGGGGGVGWEGWVLSRGEGVVAVASRGVGGRVSSQGEGAVGALRGGGGTSRGRKEGEFWGGEK